MVWRRPPLSLHVCPPQGPLETRQLRRLLAGSRLQGESGLLSHRSLPLSLLTPQPRQPLTLHFRVKVMRAGAGGGGRQSWQGAVGGEVSAASPFTTPTPRFSLRCPQCPAAAGRGGCE